MSYPSLDYFLVVAELLSISQAARRIHISQQGLSSYIKRLEEYYKADLFVRKPALGLTPAGRLLFDAARQINRIHYKLEADISAVASKSAELAAGLTPSVIRHHTDCLPLPQFRARYPDVTVSTVECTRQDCERQLTSRKIDFYLGEYPASGGALECRLLFERRYCIAVLDRLLKMYFPEDYPRCVARLERGADILEFSSMPFFAPPADAELNRRLEQRLRGTGVMLNIAGRSEADAINMQMALLGEGFTLTLPRYAEDCRRAARERGDVLRVFPTACGMLTSPVYLVCRKGERYPAYAEDMMKMIITGCESSP